MSQPKRLLGLAIAVALCGVILSLPIPNKPAGTVATDRPTVQGLNLSQFPADAPAHPLDVLFIHHSCGGQLLAAAGPSLGDNCILTSHPNGGNLRSLLKQNGYRVHEASYGSRIGEKTDIFDWLPKFRDQMEEILLCDSQDVRYTDGRRNKIVMFKSCFPNNRFQSEGSAPGNPQGPDLTVSNAKAAYSTLLEHFQKEPNVLFVCLTAPPMAPGRKAQPLWRKLASAAKAALKGDRFDLPESGRLARQFNTWLVDTNGWLKNYQLNNVVVFDYYDILTDHGRTDLSAYPTWGGADSHPNRDGHERVAQAFVPFLNKAVRRAAGAEGKTLTSR